MVDDLAQGSQAQDAAAAPGWLLVLERDAVPPEWRARAVDALVVPLLPGETRDLLTRRSAAPEISPEDEALLRLVGEGLGVATAAEALGVSQRSVYRRLARLRDRWGVRTTTELADRARSLGLGRSVAEGDVARQRKPDAYR